MTRQSMPTNIDYEKFFNFSSDLFMITDHDGRILKVNSSWETALGYTPDEMENRLFTEFVHPVDVSRSFERFQEIFGTELDDGFINRLISKSGGSVWLDWKVSLIGEHLFAVARDITFKRELVLKLSEQKEEFRKVAENSSDVIMRFDRECRHIYTNPASSRVFGFTAEEFLGKNHEELGFSKEDYEYWDSRILKVFETKQPHKEVASIFEGSVHVDWILEPEFNERGEVTSVLSITRDVSDLIKVKNELKEANGELEKFFSIIAHDLRSPFFGLINLTEIIVEDFDELSTEEIKEMQVTLLDGARRTYTLLSELLEWAVLKRGSIEFDPVNLNIRHIVEERAALLKNNLDEKRISLTINVPGILFVKADRNMLSSVVSNLLANSVKFTPRGGSIMIEGSEAGDGNVKVAIKDTGIGMSQIILDKLFKMSEKTGRKGTEGEATTGLGLLLCKEFMEKMHGSIEVESQQGKGSTFTIILPKE